MTIPYWEMPAGPERSRARAEQITKLPLELVRGPRKHPVRVGNAWQGDDFLFAFDPSNPASVEVQRRFAHSPDAPLEVEAFYRDGLLYAQRGRLTEVIPTDPAGITAAMRKLRSQ